MVNRGRANTFNKIFNRFFNGLFRLRKGKLAFKGAPACILHTTGARSGQPRKTPLLYLDAGDGRFALVASNGGDDKTPDWVHNIRAQPDVEVDLAGGRRAFRAEIADPATRADLWPRLVALYQTYDKYQAKTTREIPVVLLTPR